MKITKYYCHAPSHPFRIFIGTGDDEIHIHMMVEHREDVGTKEALIDFIERYVEEIECQK